MSSTNQGRGTGLVLFALAAVIAVVGFVNGVSGPTCGREAMSPGDTCYIDGERNTYEDRRAAAARAPLVNGLIALVLVGFGIGSLVRGSGRGRPGATPDPRARRGSGAMPDHRAPVAGRPPAGPPLARTPDEAHLAMSLDPCACGSTAFISESALFEVDGEFVRRYAGACRSCGTPREFLFRLPPLPLVAPPGEFRYGDGSRSQLLDPGAWLAVADHYARQVPGGAAGLGPARRDAARQNMVRAAAALDEVLAFAPPGAAAVPEDAFVSPLGRQVRAREPGRFRRARLEVVRDTYRQIVGELDAAPGGTAAGR